ncbi:MAG: DnaJ family domain-containing protein [Planktomarina sp.]
MDHPLHDLIEAQLAKARAEGQMDNLAGQGKPLTHLKEMTNLSEIRLESAQGLPSPLAVLRDDIAAAQAKLTAVTDDAGRKAQQQVINDLKLKLAIEWETLKRIG